MSVCSRVGASLLVLAIAASCDGGTEIVREVPYFPDTGGSSDGGDDQDTNPGDVLYAAVAPELYQLTHNRGPVAGGTILGLTGAGFRDGVKVKFGSNDGQVLGVNDAGHLVVKTPAGVAGAADVTIENPDGGTTVFARAFTYYEPDANAPSGPALLETIPSAGPSTGGTVALLRGSNFQTGAVFFIDWKVVANASVTSVENATIVTPALDVGAVDLAITNPDGLSAQLDAGFSVFAPTSGTEETTRPQITGVDPSAGSVEGGLTVTVTGSHFTQGSKLLIGGRLAQTWTVTSEDKGTFVTPPHDPGLVDIVITDAQGNSGVRQGGFLYFVNPPVIYRVEPSSGPVGGGNTVTIQGKYLSQGMTILIGGKPCTGVAVGAGDGTGTTSTFATCTVPEGDGPGPVMVEAENPDGLGGQLPGGYTYLSPTPEIDAVDPDTGSLEGGYLAVVRGQDFLPGSAVSFGATTVEVVAESPTALTVVVPASNTPGPVTVTVTATNWPTATLAGAFTYVAPGSPVLTGLSPMSTATAGGQLIAVSGTDLHPDSTVWFGGVPAVSTQYGGPLGMGVVAPPHSAGTVDVVLKTPGYPDSTLSGFTFVGPNPPALSTVTPTSGPVDGGIVVAIAGQHLRGDSQAWFGGSPATTVASGDGGLAVLLPSHAPGLVDIVVKTPAFPDATLTAAFTYQALGNPSLTSIAPTSGSTAGGVVVAVSGQNLRPTSQVWFGNVPATTSYYAGPNGLGVVAPPGAAGKVDVRVSTPGLPDAYLTAAFTYVAPPLPVITSIQPPSGSTAGGLIVIAGENLPDVITVKVCGVTAPNADVVSPGAALVTLPAHGPGTCDVVISGAGFPDAVLEDGYTFIAESAPGIEAVEPTTGPSAGGILVSVSGVGLRSDSQVWFGGVPSTPVHFGGENGLTVLLPARAAGVVDVVVKTPGEPDATLTGGFTYVAPAAPKLLSVTPASGPTEGGAVVAVVGENLRDNSQVFFGGTAASTSYYGGESGLGVVLPAHAAGVVDVVLKTPGFADSKLTAAFSYVEPGPPSVSAVIPALGPTTGGIAVLIQGDDLRPSSTVTIGGVTAQTVFSSPTGIGVLLPPGSAGPVEVRVKTTGFADVVLPGGFVYVAPEAPTGDSPVVAQVVPATGPTTGGGWVLIKGFGFPSAPKVRFGTQPAIEVIVVGSDTLSVRVPAGTVGAKDVTVESSANGATSVLPSGYTYYDPATAGPGPHLSTVKPALGPIAGGTLAWLGGTGFSTGALVFIDGRPATGVTVASGTTLTAFTPSGSLGPADVSITNPDGQSATLAAGFVYTAKANPISLSGALPGQGSVAGGNTVTVTGAGFSPGVIVFFDGVPVGSTLKGPGTLQVTTPAHSPGLVDIHVTAPDGGTAALGDAYNFILQAPFIAAVTPAYGKPSGGTQILISGQGFHPNASVTFGDTPAQVVSATETLVTAIAPAHDAGLVDVTVSNPDFLSSTLEDGFTYTDGVPGDSVQIASVHPPVGPSSGGTVLTVTGSGFEPGLAVLFGTGVGTSVIVLDSSTLLVTTPAGTHGPVDLQIVVPEVGSATRKAAFFYVDGYVPGQNPTLLAVRPAVGPTAGKSVIRLDVALKSGSAPITAVYIDGESRPILGGDATHVVVETAPHAAGAVPVAIRLASGYADVLENGFTYYTPAPGIVGPTLASIAPVDGSTAGGAAVTLTGSGFGSGPLAFLGYSGMTVVGATSGTISAITPPHAAGLVDAVVTRADGFSAVLKSAYGYSSPAPSLTAVFPTTGSKAGGLTAVVSGSGFVTGAQVFFGGVQATGVVVLDGGILQLTTPAVTSAGSVDVQVVNPDGKSATLPGAFAYIDSNFTKPPPKVTALVPANGPYQGGTVLAVYGQAIQPGAKVLFGGKPATVHLLEPGLATVTTPAGFIGKVDVTILNPDGQAGTLPAAFTYLTPVLPAPQLLGITPKSGPEAGGTAVIFTGSKLTGGGTGFIGYRPVSSWTVLNASIATGTSVAGEPGPKNVVVTNGDGQSSTLVNGWDYVGAPRIDSFDPDMGAVVGGKVVNIAGKNFSAQAVVTIGGKPVATIDVLSSFVIRVQTPPGTPGPAQVKILNPDGQSHVAEKPYLYVLPPQLDSLFPPQGSEDGGTPIIVRGQDFLPGAVVYFGDAPATAVVHVNDGELVLIAPPGLAGAVDVTVQNPDGQSAILYDAYDYVDPSSIGSDPVMTALRPPTGPTSGGTWGLGDGQYVQTGAWALFGTTPVADFETISPTLCRWVSAPAVAAEVDVTVLNPDGSFAVLPAGFVYKDDDTLDAPPNITSINPDAGATSGGTPVDFFGTELDANTLVFFGDDPAAGITYTAPKLTATTPAHGKGSVDVIVTDAEGQTIIMSDAFAFVPPPTIVSISPISGPSTGGTFVTVNGTEFVKGATPAESTKVFVCVSAVYNDGCVAADIAKTNVVSTTKLTFETPVQVPGGSDVVVVNPDGQMAYLAGAFFFTPPPKILGVNPQSGSTLGNELVTISGTGFQVGAQVTFAGQKATGVQVQNSTTLICTTPAAVPGPAVVTVTNPDLSSHSLGGGFLYIKPPKVLAVFPTVGPETGGTVVTIQGDGYVPTSRVFFGSVEVATANLQWESENVIKAKAPPGVGPVAVKIQNPDGQIGSLGGAFVYVPVIPAPNPVSVTPSFGTDSGGYVLQITGNNFLEGAQVSFGSDTIGWVNGFNPIVKNAGTLIVVTAPAHPAGVVNVRVTNTDGQTGMIQNGFEFIEPLGLPGLAFAGIEPKRGPALGGYPVTIYGQGFKQGIKVFFGKNSTSDWTEATPVVRLGPTILRVTMPAYATNGKVDLRLSNPAVGGSADEIVAPLAFTYGQTVVLVPKGQRLPIDTVYDDQQTLLFDANGDGLDDLFVTHVHGPPELYINTEDTDGIPGQLIDQTAVGMPAIGNNFYPAHPVSSDVDGDGDLDVVVLHGAYYSQSLGLFRNRGDGTFTFEDKNDTGMNYPKDMAIGDLNCDGDDDVIIVGDGNNVIMVGDGRGNWRVQSGILPAHSEPSRGVALSDVDHDGDLDMLVANESAVQNRLYYNNCNNTPLAPTCTFDVPGCTHKVYDGHRYAICTQETRANWDAEDKCSLYGYHLATINSQLENDFLRANSGNNELWLGFKEITSEHNYTWPWGSSAYTGWCSGQPNDANVDDCARMTTNANGCWDDAYCGNGYRYVCEAPVTAVCPAAWVFSDAAYGAGKNFPVSGANTRDVKFVDVNDDGWEDVVLVSYGQSTRIYINNNGNFLNDTGTRFPQTETLTQAIRVDATDVDLDNDLDLIVLKHQGNNRFWPWIYLNDKAQGGIGSYTNANPTNFPPYRGEDSVEIAVGDLNGDQLPDVVILNEDHQDWLMQNHGFAENKSMVDQNRVPIGAFANNTQLGIPEQTADAYASSVGDIDGDGDLDIVMCFTDSALRPAVWVNDGIGNFFDLTTERVPAGVACECFGIDLVDVDKDNDLDMMMSCGTGLRQLANDGTAHFANTSADNIPSWNSGQQYGQAFGDIDSDGDLDWMSSSQGYTAWRTLLNGGEVYGTDMGAYWISRNDLMDIATTISCGNCQTEKAILIRDLNGDTFPDVYVGMPGSQNQLWHNTDGKGKMNHVTQAYLPSVSDPTSCVLSSDVDLDGDIDLFVVNSDKNRLHIGELDYKYADATASNMPVLPSINSTWGEVADLDLDGYPDFFTTTWEGQNQIVLNKGGAAFESFTVDLPKDADPSRSVHAGDFDGDGVVDLFISNRQANRIYLNKTPH